MVNNQYNQHSNDGGFKKQKMNVVSHLLNNNQF